MDQNGTKRRTQIFQKMEKCSVIYREIDVQQEIPVNEKTGKWKGPFLSISAVTDEKQPATEEIGTVFVYLKQNCRPKGGSYRYGAALYQRTCCSW